MAGAGRKDDRGAYTNLAFSISLSSSGMEAL